MGGIAKVALAPVTGGASLIPGAGGAVTGFLGDPAGALTSSAPQVQSGVTQGQINTSYDQTQQAIQQQNAFLAALQAQNGIGNQSAVFNQLQGVANGTGANPALAQLNQQTGQNVAQQAALMASARGAQANPGLIARQAALQGGNLQQQAVGQGASLMASQQLNALNQLGGVANQQVAQQQNALTGVNQFTQGQQANLFGATNAANNANANINASNAASKNKMTGGLLNGLGSAAGMLAHGGEVTRKLAFGGLGAEGMPVQTAVPQVQPSLGLDISVGSAQDPVAAFMSGQPYVDQARNGAAPAASPQASKQPFHAFESFDGPGKGMFAQGGQAAIVPGKVKGNKDSLKNDKVPALLTPEEIVLPISVTKHEDAPERAKAFVAAIMAKKRKKLG